MLPEPNPTTQHPPPERLVKVLVVDDEYAIVAVETEVLRSAGYVVVGHTDPERALDEPADDLDVVVTDYRMPKLDGLELFRRLRRRQPRVVGVLVTGFGNLELVQTAMRLGVSGILLKPFPLERLTAAVARAVQQRRLTEENHRLAAILEVHAAAQNLNQPRSRHDLIVLLARLAAESAHADRACVLPADGPQGVLARPPDGTLGPLPEQIDALVGLTAAEAIASLVYVSGGPVVLALPLRLQSQDEGVLLLERDGEPFGPIELERLSLLINQGALALASLRLFEGRLREEKLAVVGQMAGAICQRLREPVARIHGAVDELNGTDHDYVEMIRGQTERLETMCHELSDFVAGGDENRLVPVSLGDLLAARAREGELTAGARPVEVVVDAPCDVVVNADERKLGRALQNLIKNAIEAMPRGGTVALRLHVEGALAVIEVADTGMGMPPEVTERVFEPFFTHGKVNGTGLGGAVVQGAVRAHGGDVEVHSVVGQGTVFRLRLPLAPAAGQAA
ncbi:MAG: hybrid sensor histidine kinase/response regulator [Armatimonadetes bacterium]|nr:hybrid sensor histidine kinase/response regulator [Armatimonadota bacterium]